MLTIIESGSQIWALAASDGDLHIYSREDVGDWTEVLLSEDSEQIDQDGSAILEALYEQNAMRNQDGQTAASEAEEEEPDEEEEPVDEEEEPVDEEEEPVDEEEQPVDEEELAEDEEEEPEDEDEDEEEEKKPRRTRSRAPAKKN